MITLQQSLPHTIVRNRLNSSPYHFGAHLSQFFFSTVELRIILMAEAQEIDQGSKNVERSLLLRVENVAQVDVRDLTHLSHRLQALAHVESVQRLLVNVWVVELFQCLGRRLSDNPGSEDALDDHCVQRQHLSAGGVLDVVFCHGTVFPEEHT